MVEEPALEGKGKVVFRGEIRFNYPVNPEVLASRIRLEDPRGSKPVAVTLETSWQSPRRRPTGRLYIGGRRRGSGKFAPMPEDLASSIPLLITRNGPFKQRKRGVLTAETESS